MAKQKIVITLPEDKMRESVLTGFNKRLKMLEDGIKDAKKKKTLNEISTLRNELRSMKEMRKSLSAREARDIKNSIGSISDALSSLGKIRIPSPS